MKKIPLSEVKDDLSRYLREAETEDVVITRHGKPAGILIGFETEDDWFDYRLEHDPRFLRRIEVARAGLRAGQGISLEQLDAEIEGAEQALAPDEARVSSRKKADKKRPGAQSAARARADRRPRG
jgi:prevent-host-death family protein